MHMDTDDEGDEPSPAGTQEVLIVGALAFAFTLGLKFWHEIALFLGAGEKQLPFLPVAGFCLVWAVALASLAGWWPRRWGVGAPALLAAALTPIAFLNYAVPSVLRLVELRVGATGIWEECQGTLVALMLLWTGATAYSAVTDESGKPGAPLMALAWPFTFFRSGILAVAAVVGMGATARLGEVAGTTVGFPVPGAIVGLAVGLAAALWVDSRGDHGASASHRE